MTIARTPTFGRRGQKAASARRASSPASSSDPFLPPRPADERFSAVAREMLRSSESEQAVQRQGEVPWSMTAALLAGIAASCLQAGLYIVAAKGPIEIIPGLKMTLGSSSEMLLMAITLGLWRGAQVAVTAIMLSHLAMRFTQMSSPTAYGIAGAVSGAIYAYGLDLLTEQSASIWATAASGLAAGFLYRLFAGLRS